MNEPLVSIVITTRNEEKNIDNCLKSIRLQTYGNIEIIVVDNFSTDKTKETAKKYIDKVYDKGPERSAQRNFGMIKISRGDYVMYADADMIFSPCLIEACIAFIKRNDFIALYIPEIILGTSYWSKVRRFERNFYDGTVIDAARFFIKDVFVKAGGFDETLSGPEDWDLDKRIKKIGAIGLLKGNKPPAANWSMRDFIIDRGLNPHAYGAVVYHNEAEFDLRKYLQKKGYYAKNMGLYISKWGKDDPDIKKQLGLFYRFLGVFIESGKWKRFLLQPALVLGLYLLKIQIGIIFLISKRSNKL